jgi:hypothetical protein
VSDTLPLAPARPAHHSPRVLDETETIFLDYATTGTSITGIRCSTCANFSRRAARRVAPTCHRFVEARRSLSPDW